jgi:hypothetical protein
VRVDDAFTNPLRVLGDWAIPPKATMTHYYMLKAKRSRLHARAPARRRAAQRATGSGEGPLASRAGGVAGVGAGAT